MTGVVKKPQRPPAALNSSLTTAKGQAAPVQPFAPLDVLDHSVENSANRAVTGNRRSRSKAGQAPAKDRIALTLRLEPSRFSRLKDFGAHTGRTHQDILLAALESYLAQHAHTVAPCRASLGENTTRLRNWARRLDLAKWLIPSA